MCVRVFLFLDGAPLRVLDGGFAIGRPLQRSESGPVDPFVTKGTRVNMAQGASRISWGR